MSRLGLLVVLVAQLGALPAAATVAVAVTTPDHNVRHREVAAGLVSALRARWDFLSPPLDPAEAAPCAADVACLYRLAQRKGADWLVAVGVAGFGARGAIVTVQLVGTDGKTRVDETTIVAGTADPRADGAALAPRLLAVPGPPPARPVVERVAEAPSQTPSLWAASLVGGGAALVGVGAGVGAALLTSSTTRDAALPIVVGTGVVGVACAAVGAVVVAVDP